MNGEHMLVLGGDLASAEELGPMTKKRVNRAIAYAKEHTGVHAYAAAGIFSEFPDMKNPMAFLMVNQLHAAGVDGTLIGPDFDFNTRGELRVFMEATPKVGRKCVVSSWWHLPRVRRIIELEWGKEVADSFLYIKSDDALTLKLAFLESLKWVLTFAPETLRDTLVGAYRKMFGRSSW